MMLLDKIFIENKNGSEVFHLWSLQLDSESPIERSVAEIVGHLLFTFAKNVVFLKFWLWRCYPFYEQNAKK